MAVEAAHVGVPPSPSSSWIQPSSSQVIARVVWFLLIVPTIFWTMSSDSRARARSRSIVDSPPWSVSSRRSTN